PLRYLHSFPTRRSSDLGVISLFGSYMSLWHHVVGSLRSAWPAIEVDGAEALAARAEDVLRGRAPADSVRQVGTALIRQSSGALRSEEHTSELQSLAYLV